MTDDLTNSLDRYRRQIDQRLEELLPTVLPGQVLLEEGLRAGVLAPGKRLRPLMTVIVAEDLGGLATAALDAGCAVEMIHAASLVLDDLPCMDDAALRRGLPAVHIGHGEDVAVLTAIGALSRSYEVLAGIDRLSAEARIESVAILSRAVGTVGLVGGQFEDLRGGRGRRPVADIAAANGLKTGSLFSAAVEIGGVVAGVGEPTRARLRNFARELGYAFQLLDDLLDGASSPILIGKDVGKDIGKSTIISILGSASTRRLMERHVQAARKNLDDIFGPGSRLHHLVERIFDDAGIATLENDLIGAGGRRDQEVGVR